MTKLANQIGRSLNSDNLKQGEVVFAAFVNFHVFKFYRSKSEVTIPSTAMQCFPTFFFCLFIVITAYMHVYDVCLPLSSSH